jgi:hypothetical protein
MEGFTRASFIKDFRIKENERLFSASPFRLPAGEEFLV